MYQDMTLKDFTDVLASGAPTPGGGGASALAGALGTALGNMVGSLTVGKLDYYEVEEEMEELCQKAKTVEKELLELIDEDEKAFMPLMEAYKLPHNTEVEKAKRVAVLTAAKSAACQPPIKIMRKCCEAIDIISVFAEKGNKGAVSDAGAGAVLCGAALRAASLNVFINTKYLDDKEYAGKLNDETNAMLEEYVPKAEAIYNKVSESLK